MFGFDGNKETCEWCKHEQKMPIVKKDKDNADGHFEASSFLLAQQLQNQSLLDNKYVELEKKVNMEKERYEKEIGQLKDEKNVGSINSLKKLLLLKNQINRFSAFTILSKIYLSISRNWSKL